MHVDSLFRTIGIFAVKFRWLVLAAWVAATIAAIALLPALSSVTQSNNTKFLPASAPSEHAAQLAAPFGTAGLVPVPVVAARSDGPLTAADARAVVSLRSRLATIPSVSKVIDSGRSPDGQAMQLVVLARQMGGGQNTAENLVDTMRADIAGAGLPAGLHAHLAGALAVQVDQQKASGNTGSQVQNLSLIFIIVLLVLIFRSLTLALATVAPALLAVLISGPLVAEAARHGLQVSPLAQYLMIVLVLGAGTDYGLFLVFRVREELREAGHADEVYAPGRGGLLRAVGRD
ncbi:MAG: MMPL family transporter, partial [Actinobacteria bacterium]|nr:MMPL family transporter [Actinomycetota bacterium]